MEVKAIEDMLAQLRATASLAKGGGAAAAAGASGIAGTGTPSSVDFGAAMKSALDGVNAQQAQAGAMAKDYELGNGNLGLHDVVIAMQKANISFQGTVQVRNKVVAAYNEIMNMQI